MSGFRIVDTVTIARAGFLTVDELSVADPEGERHRRVVIRHPGAVMVVPIDADGRALLVRQYRAAAGRDLLEIPAGKRDVAGEPPPVTATRELDEEIGRHPGRLVKLAECYNSPGFCDEYAHIYAALDLGPPHPTAPQGAEERAMRIEPVAFDAVDTLIARGELIDAKSIIGLLLARRFIAGEYAGMTPPE